MNLALNFNIQTRIKSLKLFQIERPRRKMVEFLIHGNENVLILRKVRIMLYFITAIKSA